MGFHENLVQSFQNFKNTCIDPTTSELDSSIVSLSTSLSEIDSTQNVNINSLATDNASQDSLIDSLSQSLSELNVVAGSLTTENSTQTININSLSTTTSEISDDIVDLQSEVATKQDELTAGVGISIVNGVISANPGISMTIVQTLPTTDISTTTIYLVPSSQSATNNVYDEFVYVNNAWEQIGSTAIDLTNYYNKTEVDTLLDDKQDVLTAGTGITIDANNVISSSGGSGTIYWHEIYS